MQPPSGGCVLKLTSFNNWLKWQAQPPSGGCVLKQYLGKWLMRHFLQPPSGGCVLKLLETANIAM